MNLDQIALRIADPDSCQGHEIVALKELTEKYPFSQVFSILYLKALSSQNDIRFDEALQMHAYRITDRMKLYDLIHSRQAEEFPEAIAEAENVPAEESVETVRELQPVEEVIAEIRNEMAASVQESALAEETVPETVQEENQPEILPEAGESEVIVPEAEIPEELAESVAAEEPETEATVIPEEEPALPETAEETISELEAVIAAEETESGESAENRIEPGFVNDELELEIISQVVATVYNDNLENSIPEKPVEEKKPEPLINKIPDAEKGVLESRRSFSSWLKTGNQPAETQTQPIVQQPVKEVKAVDKQVDKIISQFIEKEPSISRPKKEFYSPTKKAKQSVNPEGLIYTETLANIFAIQGNFPKAIIAYEQLMLTNPEKKIFFAQRIKELKEKLNT